jgi:hypothetical protein
VRWLFDQLRGGRRRHTAVACYLRENGPIAYELSLFAENPRERVDAMFETGLSWYWSTDRGATGSEPPEWIELTRWSIAALLSDLATADGAWILIVGVERQDVRTDLARSIAGWSRRFATDDRSPLHALIHHAPGHPEHVFVAQQPPENVRGLLQAWGIDRARADRRAYPRLRDQSLESLLDRLPR